MITYEYKIQNKLSVDTKFTENLIRSIVLSNIVFQLVYMILEIFFHVSIKLMFLLIAKSNS